MNRLDLISDSVEATRLKYVIRECYRCAKFEAWPFTVDEDTFVKHFALEGRGRIHDTLRLVRLSARCDWDGCGLVRGWSETGVVEVAFRDWLTKVNPYLRLDAKCKEHECSDKFQGAYLDLEEEVLWDHAAVESHPKVVPSCLSKLHALWLAERGKGRSTAGKRAAPCPDAGRSKRARAQRGDEEGGE